MKLGRRGAGTNGANTNGNSTSKLSFGVNGDRLAEYRAAQGRFLKAMQELSDAQEGMSAAFAAWKAGQSDLVFSLPRLTFKQQKVMEFGLGGLTVKETAIRMNMTTRMVKFNRGEILRKLGVAGAAPGDFSRYMLGELKVDGGGRGNIGGTGR